MVPSSIATACPLDAEDLSVRVLEAISAVKSWMSKCDETECHLIQHEEHFFIRLNKKCSSACRHVQETFFIEPLETYFENTLRFVCNHSKPF